jgi:hypothetical protein
VFYVIDRIWRIICRGSDFKVVRDMAIRIAAAGAWCSLVADDDSELRQINRIGQSEAWRMENPDMLHVDLEDLERIVG